MNGPGFKKVTREEFKEVYFRLGGGASSGWMAGYWQDVIKPFTDGLLACELARLAGVSADTLRHYEHTGHPFCVQLSTA